MNIGASDTFRFVSFRPEGALTFVPVRALPAAVFFPLFAPDKLFFSIPMVLTSVGHRAYSPPNPTVNTRLRIRRKHASYDLGKKAAVNWCKN